MSVWDNFEEGSVDADQLTAFDKQVIQAAITSTASEPLVLVPGQTDMMLVNCIVAYGWAIRNAEPVCIVCASMGRMTDYFLRFRALINDNRIVSSDWQTIQVRDCALIELHSWRGATGPAEIINANKRFIFDELPHNIYPALLGVWQHTGLAQKTGVHMLAVLDKHIQQEWLPCFTKPPGVGRIVRLLRYDLVLHETDRTEHVFKMLAALFGEEMVIYSNRYRTVRLELRQIISPTEPDNCQYVLMGIETLCGETFRKCELHSGYCTFVAPYLYRGNEVWNLASEILKETRKVK